MANDVKRGQFFSCRFVQHGTEHAMHKPEHEYQVVLSRKITFESIRAPSCQYQAEGILAVYDMGMFPVVRGVYYRCSDSTFEGAEELLEKQEVKFNLADYSSIQLDRHDEVYCSGCAFLHKEVGSGSAVDYIQLDGAESYTEALEAILDKIASIPVEIYTGCDTPEDPII